MPRALLAYGGVWRSVQDDGAGNPVPASFALTTAWQPLLGYTENRPNTSKKATADYTTGLVEIEEDGVYLVVFTLAFNATLNRYVDFGVRIDGVDPLAPTFRQEVLSSKGITETTYSTMVTVTGAPNQYYFVAKGEIAMNMDFYFGGWSLSRIDYISPDDVGISMRIF